MLFSRVRIPAKHVYYYRCPDHRKNYVMSFAFNFDKENEAYQFSYCFPYSYTRLQNYLDNLDKRALPFYRRELLCYSVVSSWFAMVVGFRLWTRIGYCEMIITYNLWPITYNL